MIMGLRCARVLQPSVAVLSPAPFIQLIPFSGVTNAFANGLGSIMHARRPMHADHGHLSIVSILRGIEILMSLYLPYHTDRMRSMHGNFHTVPVMPQGKVDASGKSRVIQGEMPPLIYNTQIHFPKRNTSAKCRLFVCFVSTRNHGVYRLYT